MLLRAFLLIVALALPGVTAAECISMPTTLAEAFARHSAVFIGDVTEAVVTDATPGVFPVYVVAFNVREAFKGIRPGPHTLRFTLSAENFAFERDQRVLVFAAPVSNEQTRDAAPPALRAQYSIACTPTAPVSMGSPWLLELRRLAQPPRGAP